MRCFTDSLWPDSLCRQPYGFRPPSGGREHTKNTRKNIHSNSLTWTWKMVQKEDYVPLWTRDFPPSVWCVRRSVGILGESLDEGDFRCGDRTEIRQKDHQGGPVHSERFTDLTRTASALHTIQTQHRKHLVSQPYIIYPGQRILTPKSLAKGSFNQDPKSSYRSSDGQFVLLKTGGALAISRCFLIKRIKRAPCLRFLSSIQLIWSGPRYFSRNWQWLHWGFLILSPSPNICQYNPPTETSSVAHLGFA